MIDPTLLRLLCCPETHQPVALVERSVMVGLNAAIQAGRLRNRSGQLVREPAEGGLIREDRLLLYLIRHGIPILLMGEGIALDAQEWGGLTDRSGEV